MKTYSRSLTVAVISLLVLSSPILHIAHAEFPPIFPLSTSTTSQPSDPATADQIIQLYVTLLNRQPDQDGLNYWLGTGESVEQIQQAIMSSTEYIVKSLMASSTSSGTFPSSVPALSIGTTTQVGSSKLTVDGPAFFTGAIGLLDQQNIFWCNAASAFGIPSSCPASIFWNAPHPGGGELQLTSNGSMSLNIGYGGQASTLQLGGSGYGNGQTVIQYGFAPTAANPFGKSQLLAFGVKYWNGTSQAFSKYPGLQAQAADASGNADLRYYSTAPLVDNSQTPVLSAIFDRNFFSAPTFIATSTTSTSTFANGINLTGGCVAVNGVCVIGNGGSASTTSNTTLVTDASSIQIMSPAAGGSGDTDWIGKTPAFTGQLGESFYGNHAPGMWVSKSTNVSDWKGMWNFPAGVESLGSPDNMGDDDHVTYVYENGSNAGYTRRGDAYLAVINMSHSMYSSGSGFCGAITDVDGVTGSTTVNATNAACIGAAPWFDTMTILPSQSVWAMNTDAKRMRYASVASPGLGDFPLTQGGIDTGNFSTQVNNLIDRKFEIPYFTKCVYAPDQTLYSFTVSGVTNAPSFNDNYGSGSSRYTICDVNLSGGSGTITAVATTSPPASGTMRAIEVVGSGDTSISYSAVSAVSTWRDSLAVNLKTGATTIGTTTISNLTVTDRNATSTFAGGINVTGGCLAVNGTCVIGGTSGSFTSNSLVAPAAPPTPSAASNVISAGANATTTVTLGELNVTSSKTCINMNRVNGKPASFYISPEGKMIVETNYCKGTAKISR